MDQNFTEGSVSWICPSNIAIVKYWGKHGRQLPNNPSISFTLSNAHTETKMFFSPNETENFSINFFLDGNLNEKFGERTMKYFSSIKDYFPFIENFNFSIESKNTFPHSSGIASSASGMGALAMCLCEMESIINGSEIDLKKASMVARLGSGSACRSIYPKMALWGETQTVQSSSNEYALPVVNIHDAFKTYHDDILIVSSGEKEVSSSVGHALMDNNVYAETRYRQAHNNIDQLMGLLINGDVETFVEIAETEALTLHALMMCSNPSFILMQPHTLTMISKIRNFRKETKLPVCFTLDAGPNIHLLYPHEIKDHVEKFIESDLKSLCQDGLIIKDFVGNGPIRY